MRNQLTKVVVFCSCFHSHVLVPCYGPFPAVSTALCWYLPCCVNGYLLVPSLLCQRLSVGTFPAVSTAVCWYLPCCVNGCLLVPSLLCQRLSVGTFPAVSTVVCWYLPCCVHCCLLVPSLLCPLLSVGTFPAVSTVVCWSSGHVPILPWSPMVSPTVYLLVTLTACSHCCCRLPLVIPQRGCSYICTRVVKMSSRPGSFSSSTRCQSSMHSVNKTTTNSTALDA